MKKNFKRKLSLVCSKEKNQETLHYLYFRNGFVYCTNAHVLVRHSLKSHDFTEEEIALLDDVCMHREVFDVIYGYESVSVVKEGNQVLFVGTKGKVTAKYGLHSAEKEEQVEPNFEAVIPQGKLKLCQKSILGMNLEYLALLKSVVLSEHPLGPLVEMFFQGESGGAAANRPVVIRSWGFELKDELIILMPCIKTGSDIAEENDIEPETETLES